MMENKLIKFIEQRKHLWTDPEQVETVYLSGNETLVDFYIQELEELVRLYEQALERNQDNVME